jgi:hypothetical protein
MPACALTKEHAHTISFPRRLRRSQQPSCDARHNTASPLSTTSFLTATTLVYAFGAGITAAAGTRLALQWVLVNRFKLYSFQLPGQRPRISMYCHYLPASGLGNLRACCLPWKWWPSLRPPLRNRTLIPRYPWSPRLSNTQPSKVDRAET